MAESRIKKSDIAEEDVFAYVGQSAEKNLAKVIALDTQLRKVTETLAGVGRGAGTDSLTGINQLVLVQKELDVVVKQAIETDKQKLITEKALEKQRLAEIKLQQEREKSIDRYNAKLEKERQQEEKLASVYNKVQAKLTALKREYREIAVRKDLGLKLTDQEAKRYEFLAGKIDRYDTALKATDASMGQHQRNVGNYKQAWNGLGNSVSQLAREMPAFANSMQTGFMAISNNLPMFFDEIKKINDQNKVLKANGEQTTSLFKQLSGSIFSLSTGLSIGVTLLTVYGAKIFEWAGSLFESNKEVDKSAKLLKARNEEQAKSAKYIAEESAQFIGNILALKKTNAGSDERKRLIKDINEQYGTTLQNLKDEAKFQAQLNVEVASYLEYAKAKYRIQRNEEAIANNLERQDKLQRQISTAKKEQLRIDKELIKQQEKLNSASTFTSETKIYSDYEKQVEVIAKLKEAQKENNDVLNQSQIELEEARKRFETYGTGILLAQNNIEKLTKGGKKYNTQTKETKDKTDKQNESLKTTNEYLGEQLKLKNDLAQIDLENLQSTLDEEIKQLTENMLRDVRETGELDVDYLEQLINDRFALEQYYREQKLAMDIAEIEANYKAQTQAEKDALKEKYDAIIKEHGNLTAEQQAEYDNELKIIEANRLKREADFELKKQALQKKSGQEQIKIEKDRNAKINDVNDTLNDGLDEWSKNNNDRQKKDRDELEKTEKEKRDIIQKYGDEIIDGLIDRSKEREKILNSELDASKKQEDYLRQLAINGNADAKQSLSAQENVTKEKQRLADQEARKQRQLEEAKMVYKSILQFMDKGDSLPEATAKGIAGTIGLRKLIASLPAFFKGTKGTVADELGAPMMQGRDGYIVRVDGSEKVLNGELSRMTGSATTDEIVNGYLMARNMQNVLMPMQVQTSTANQFEPLTKEMRELKSIIKNKPEVQFSNDVIMGISRGLVMTEKTGLTRQRTTFRP